MKTRRLMALNLRVAVNRNRKIIRNLMKLKHGHTLSSIILAQEGHKVTEEPNFQNVKRNQSKFKILIEKTSLKIQRRLKDAKDTACYCANTVKEWFGLTFCFIIIKKKKIPGVLKSVRI